MTQMSHNVTNLHINKSQILFESDTFFCNNILLHIAKYYLLDFTTPFFPLPHFVYGGVLDINIVVVLSSPGLLWVKVRMNSGSRG